MTSDILDQSRWASKGRGFAIQARHRALLAAARVVPGMRVLDLATGRGEMAVLAARVGAAVHATDLTEALVQTAVRNATRANVVITSGVADMRDLAGIPSGSFDIVLGCAGLHHLDKAGARQAVAEAIRVLVPGGRALFLEPVENVRWFDFIKHCFPSRLGRPSVLNRRAWRSWEAARDDRWMSDAELLQLWPTGRIVGRLGLLQRITAAPIIERVDAYLLKWKVLRAYSQAAIVEYRA